MRSTTTGQAFGRWRGGPVRLVERPIRRVLASGAADAVADLITGPTRNARSAQRRRFRHEETRRGGTVRAPTRRNRDDVCATGGPGGDTSRWSSPAVSWRSPDVARDRRPRRAPNRLRRRRSARPEGEGHAGLVVSARPAPQSCLASLTTTGSVPTARRPSNRTCPPPTPRSTASTCIRRSASNPTPNANLTIDPRKRASRSRRPRATPRSVGSSRRCTASSPSPG